MLDQRHLDHLHGSAISAEIIAARGYTSILPGDIYTWRQIAGSTHSDALLKTVLHQGALTFPLRRCAEETPHTWILRPDLPRTKDGKPIKYEYPKATANVLDILPSYRDALGNPAIDCWITEGAKKADALATAYGQLILPINENGVWGWRSKGKILDDFRRIVWEGRRVVVAPDGDVRHNKAVYQAVQRSARLFTAWGASEVLILLLPCEKNGPKIGVDDFLAQGRSLDELESHLVELTVVGEQTRVSLMRHPASGVPLYLPAGYDVYNQIIVKKEGDGEGRHVYSGLLAVTETGTNPHTKEESVTVAFDRYGKLEPVTLPRLALTSGQKVAETLGAIGAIVHGGNGREVSRYLVEFIKENEPDLPRFYQIDRLGNVGDDGLVLPAGALNIDREVRYTGPEVKVGTDHDIYPLVLREVSRWDGMTTFWATLALALAGPIINRMRPDRNPVLLLANASGSGKTTIVNFATGSYGDPSTAPLRIQCASKGTTPKGILQTMAIVNGVPLHLEDIHLLMKRDPDSFAGMIYDFANGQLRTYGTLNQKGGGGTRLGGALIMSGEAVPQLEFEGSQRRLMTINCKDYLPLAVAAKSDEGGMRAEMITNAWKTGAGSFGHRTCEMVWSNWDAFQRDVALLQVDPALGNLQAWKPLLAAAAQTLRCALLPLGIALDWPLLLRQWAAIYATGQATNDPAQNAFEKVLVMLSQCEVTTNSERSDEGHRSVPTWEWLNYERKVVAARRIGDGYWRVMTTSPQWKMVIGESAIDMYGTSWLQAGFIRTHNSSRPVSDREYLGPGKGYIQCIFIPEKHLPMTEPVE